MESIALPSAVYNLSGSCAWHLHLGLWLQGSGQSIWPDGKRCREERASRDLSETLFLLLKGAVFKLKLCCCFSLSYSSCHVAAWPCPPTGSSDPHPHPHVNILAWFQPTPTALPSDPRDKFDPSSSHQVWSDPQQADALDWHGPALSLRRYLMTLAGAASDCWLEWWDWLWCPVLLITMGIP